MQALSKECPGDREWFQKSLPPYVGAAKDDPDACSSREDSVEREESDAALWLAAVSGSARCFGDLMDRHRQRIYGKALVRMGNVHDAEDVVATVFLEAWRNRKHVRIVNGSALPWLLTVTVNVSLNLNRSKRRYRRLLAAAPPSEAYGDPSEAVAEYLDSQARARDLTRAMSKLSSVDQSIVELVLVEELTLIAAAAALELPVGTVKSKLHRARKKLQVDLGYKELPYRAVDGAQTSGGVS